MILSGYFARFRLNWTKPFSTGAHFLSLSLSPVGLQLSAQPGCSEQRHRDGIPSTPARILPSPTQVRPPQGILKEC